MASGMSQHVTYRLPEEAIADIRYLAFLIQTIPGRVITTWISAIALAVDTKAGTRERGAMTAQWGTFMTFEEQQARGRIASRLMGIRGHKPITPPQDDTLKKRMARLLYYGGGLTRLQSLSTTRSRRGINAISSTQPIRDPHP